MIEHKPACRSTGVHDTQFTMLNRVKELFLRVSETTPAGAEDDPGESGKSDEILIGACALLVEAAVLDGEFGADERQTINNILTQRMSLNDAEAAEILGAAETLQKDANQLLSYTRTIKQGFSHEERVEIIEMLWEVAYADGVLHDYEANLLRRVGGLIYVTDRERGDARRRVEARLATKNDDE